MKHGSLFAGIGGFDLGFERAGIETVWAVENDKNCNQVLATHWPDVERHGDVRKVGKSNLAPIDVISGGFPCQDLSVAGRREGLVGRRSGLWFEFARIVKEMEAKWIVVENVPGLLSSNKGDDFATIVGTLEQFGYCVAWRVLDSQYFGVAQQRRRIFIVGSLGNGSAIEILFDEGRKPMDSGTKTRSLPALAERWGQRADYRYFFGYGFAPDGTYIVQDLNAQGNGTLTRVPRRMDGTDAPRMKALGNAVTVNVAEWLGRRLVLALDKLTEM